MLKCVSEESAFLQRAVEARVTRETQGPSAVAAVLIQAPAVVVVISLAVFFTELTACLNELTQVVRHSDTV